MNVIDAAKARSEDGKTLIISNGSKWAGQAPDNIETLLDVLEDYILDPMFERYGIFHCVENNPILEPGADRFSGNFQRLSHCFDIVTIDPDVSAALKTAIKNNLQSEEYQRQAFELYSNWFVIEGARGLRLVKPSVAQDIEAGNITKMAYPRDYDTLIQATVIGPRFNWEEKKRYS